MEAALPHFQRLANSRFYQQYAVPSRLSSNYLHDIIPQHPSLLQQYLAYYNEPLVPLDLSLKSTTPITPPCTPPPQPSKRKADDAQPPKIFRHFEEPDQPDKKDKDDDNSNDSESPEAKKLKFTKQFFEELKSCLPEKPETPSKSDRSSPDIVEIKDVEERPKKSPKPAQPLKKSKAVRRLMFDEDKTSPVSGTIIRDLAEDETLVVRKVNIQTYLKASCSKLVKPVRPRINLFKNKRKTTPSRNDKFYVATVVAQTLLIRRSYHTITAGWFPYRGQLNRYEIEYCAVFLH